MLRGLRLIPSISALLCPHSLRWWFHSIQWFLGLFVFLWLANLHLQAGPLFWPKVVYSSPHSTSPLRCPLCIPNISSFPRALPTVISIAINGNSILPVAQALILGPFLNMFFFSFVTINPQQILPTLTQNISRLWSLFITSSVTTPGCFAWIIVQPPHWPSCFCLCLIMISSQQSSQLIGSPYSSELFWNSPMATIPFGEVAQVLKADSTAQHHCFITLAQKTETQQVASPLTSCSRWDGKALWKEPNVWGFGCHWGREWHRQLQLCLLHATPYSSRWTLLLPKTSVVDSQEHKLCPPLRQPGWGREKLEFYLLLHK